MASVTAFDSLAFVAAALSALTEKQIVTKVEYDRISKEIKSGENKVYVCAGEINVVEEIEQTYAKTAQLVAQRYSPDIASIESNECKKTEVNISNEIWESGDNVDEDTIILIPTQPRQTRKWFHRLGCMGSCSIFPCEADSPKLTPCIRYDPNSERIYSDSEQDEGILRENESIEICDENQSSSLSSASRRIQRTSKTIDLFVVLPLGGTITVEMESTNSLVANIKYKIKEKLGLAVIEQVLHFGGYLLEDGKSLNEYKIKANSTIHLSVKGRGGSPKALFYIDSTYLDPRWDYDFTNITDGNNQFKRGGYPYYRPCGWKRIAVKVSGIYHNDIWLGQTGGSSKGEWAVTYHGTNAHVFNNIANEGYKIGNRAAYGRGVYSSPHIGIAESFAAGFKFEGIDYIAVFQNRVNPKGVNIVHEGQYWVCSDKNDIRPYGLCVRKK